MVKITDADTNYLSNSNISGFFFNGETVPGDNTISETRNLTLKQEVDRIINGINNWSTNQTDTYGHFNSIGRRLYKQLLDGKDPKLTEDEEYLIVNRYGSPPLVMQRLDDFKEPDSI